MTQLDPDGFGKLTEEERSWVLGRQDLHRYRNQQEVAADLGISRSLYTKVVSGSRPAKPILRRRLMDVLGREPGTQVPATELDGRVAALEADMRDVKATLARIEERLPPPVTPFEPNEEEDDDDGTPAMPTRLGPRRAWPRRVAVAGADTSSGELESGGGDEPETYLASDPEHGLPTVILGDKAHCMEPVFHPGEQLFFDDKPAILDGHPVCAYLLTERRYIVKWWYEHSPALRDKPDCYELRPERGKPLFPRKDDVQILGRIVGRFERKEWRNPA